MLLFAANDPLTLTFDPALPRLGLTGTILLAIVLCVLTIWTYIGVPGASPRRVAVVLALRLFALLLACLELLRPSLAFRDELRVPSVLLVGVDASESMNIQDESDNKSRWNYARELLQQSQPQLQKLKDEQNIDIVLFRFGSEVAEFDPKGEANGKRTDFGSMLNERYEKFRSERNLRGLLLLSDGADNGVRYPALSVAGQWRSLPCPIHTFAFGNATTSEKQRDIALLDIVPEPSPVPIKGELSVTTTVDASGFENAPVNIRLFLDDKEVPAEKIFINDRDATSDRLRQLPLTTGNKLRVQCSAPATPGEVKVSVKIDPLQGEMSIANNEIATYVTVAKEGVSVLIVDKYRFPEPQFIVDALRNDPTIRLRVAWLRSGSEVPEQTDLFQFGKQHYDVIIVGDVTARQLAAGNPRALRTIKDLVNNGVGFMMIGGYSSFGNGDWRGTDIADILPVRLDPARQIEGDIKIKPTERGLSSYIMNLADNPKNNAAIWNELPELRGVTQLGEVKIGATELAKSADGRLPLLVGQEYGSGRTLAFAGDTTYRWRRSPEGLAQHARFWKQIVLWLAKQEERKGSIVVKPESRRLAAGSKLGFGLGLKGKGGTPAKEANFQVHVVSPANDEIPVETTREKDEDRGLFWKTDQPGEYRLVVRGWGKDLDGTDIPAETATLRFLVHQDDAESTRRAADHEFLKKLAAAGGGQFHRADELSGFLQELAYAPLPQGQPKANLWPDWRNKRLSVFIVGFFLAFVAILSGEWFLRRRWGLV